MLIAIREYDPKVDQAFIYSTWTNNVWYSSKDPMRPGKREFFSALTKKITQTLAESKVIIACVRDIPDMIIGYAVTKDNKLEWYYIKKDYRNMGIEELLTKGESNGKHEEGRSAPGDLGPDQVRDPGL